MTDDSKKKAASPPEGEKPATPEEVLKNSINRIIHADNIEYMRSLPSECIDFIFCDPPYNLKVKKPLTEFKEGRHGKRIYLSVTEAWDHIGDDREYMAYCKKWLTECRRLLKPNGAIMIIGSFHCIYIIGYTLMRLGYKIIDDIIWYKADAMPAMYARSLKHLHETIIWAKKSEDSKHTYNYHTAKHLGLSKSLDGKSNNQLGSIWRIFYCQGQERLRAPDGTRIHPTQKPLKLMETIIAIATRTGDLVLDPFSGTGTTAAVAKNFRRRFIGIEKEAKYIAPSIKRVAAVKGERGEIIDSYWDVNRKEHIEKEKAERNKSLFDK